MVFDDRSNNGVIVTVWGSSDSLKLSSRIQDRDVIYKSVVSGPWDYHLDPSDPMYHEILKMMKEKDKE